MGSHKIPESERYKGFANWVQFILARGLVSLLQVLPIGLAYKIARASVAYTKVHLGHSSTQLNYKNNKKSKRGIL